MVDPEQIPVIGSVVRATTPEELNEIPIFGDVWEATNAVTDFVEYGCFPTWTVWVDTLIPALGTALLQLFGFSMSEVIRGYFRPTNLRGIGSTTRVPRRGGKGKRGGGATKRRFPRPPEIGDEIGKALPGSKFFQGRKVTGVERWVWVIDFQFQKFFWWWLVADVSQNFIVNWTTAIMESEACKRPRPGFCHAVQPEAQPTGPGGWTAFILWDIISNHPDDFFNASAGTLNIPAGHKAYITFFGESGAIEPFENEGNQLRIGNTDDDDPLNKTTVWPVGSGDDGQFTALTCEIQGPRFVTALIKPHGTGLQFIRNATLTAELVATP